MEYGFTRIRDHFHQVFTCQRPVSWIAPPSLAGMKPVNFNKGFTLVELFVAMAIFSLVLVILLLMLGEVNRAWVVGEQRVESFQNGRAILELVSRELAQAVISDKLQFVQDPKLAPNVPNLATNASSLFWQAPLGSTINGNICVVGYYLTRTDPSGASAGQYQLRRLLISPDNTNSYYGVYSTEPNATNTPWVESLHADAFKESGEAGLSSSGKAASTVVSDGILAFWARCLDSNGNPIPWLSGSSTANGNPAAAPLKFNSAANFQPAIPGMTNSVLYTDPATTLPAHRLPAAVELTLITLDSRTLKRNPVIPQMDAATNQDQIPAKIEKFLRDAIANGIQSARVFSTTVRLSNETVPPPRP